MPNVTINLTKWYHFVLALMPIFAFIATSLMWVDSRYMHRKLSDTKFNEVQMRIVKADIRVYHRKVAAGDTISPEEEMQYEVDIDQMKLLMKDRNKLLNMGPSDQ